MLAYTKHPLSTKYHPKSCFIHSTKTRNNPNNKSPPSLSAYNALTRPFAGVGGCTK